MVFIRSSSSDGIDRHIEHSWCHWNWRIGKRGLTTPGIPARPPAAEEDEHAHDCSTDHCSRCCEGSVTDGVLPSQLPSLLGHRVQLV